MRPEEIALVAAVVGYLGTSSQPKTYTVSTRVMAVANPPDYWLDLYAKNRLASYKDLIGNYQFISDALQAAGSSVDPGLAQSKLALGHDPDTNTVQLVVTDTEPARAAEIVNALADGFVARNDADNQRLLARPRAADAGPPGEVDLLKLDTPTAPTTASGPRVKVNTLAAGVLGAVAGLLVVFATIYVDDTLKRPLDLERYLELPTLVSVPYGASAPPQKE
jgi:capsular polysaccharide biosynthesis protein